MASDKRDLMIGIDGDPQGFDRASKSAQESARAFDRELSKLEREQAAVERQMAKSAEAVKQFGRAQDKAALDAVRFGRAAKDAADKAAESQRRAAEAADKLERGEISAAEAGKLAARAEGDVERAAIAAAVAQQRNAAAADRLAAQQREVARAATLAAAAQRLAELKAAGAVEDHNRLLKNLESEFGKLEREGSGAFKSMERESSRAFKLISKGGEKLAGIGPLWILAIIAALEALGPAAVFAGGLITLGLGGALLALPIKAAASSAGVKSAFHGVGKDIGHDLDILAEPFQQTLEDAAIALLKAFQRWEPTLKGVFDAAAPEVDKFIQLTLTGLDKFQPAVHALGGAFDKILQVLGPRMGEIAQNVSTGLTAIFDQSGKHAHDFGQMVVDLSQVVRIAGQVVGTIISWYGPINTVLGIVNPLLGFFRTLHVLTGKTGEGLAAGATLGSTAMQTLTGATTSNITKTHELMSAQEAAAMSSNDLKNALDKLTGANQSAFDANIRYRQALVAATAAGKANSAGITGNSAAAIDNAQKLSALAQAIKDVENNGHHTAAEIAEMRQRFVDAAEAMGLTSRQANLVADRLLGVRAAALRIPSQREIAIRAKTAQATGDIMAFIRWASKLHVDLGLETHLGYAGGGRTGYASGGRTVQRFPGGGRVRGPGTTTSDSIAMVSNLEYVTNARSTEANLPLLEAINAANGPLPAAAMTAPRPVTGRVRGGDGAAAVTVQPSDVHVYIDGREVFTAVQRQGRDSSSRNHGRDPFATAGSSR